MTWRLMQFIAVFSCIAVLCTSCSSGGSSSPQSPASTAGAPNAGASVSKAADTAGQANASAAGASAANPDGAPDIEFETMEHDFGTVAGGAKLTYSFKFRNTGKAELVIQDVKGGWGCTATLVSDKVLPPGGEGKIDVTFSVGNYRGPKKKTISVQTNDPDESKLTLTVAALIEIEFDVNPRSVNVGRIHKDSGFTKRLAVEGKDLENLKITEMKPSSEFIEGKLVYEEQEGKKTPAIDLTVKKGLAVGRVRESLTVRTNRESIPEVVVNIFGEILGDISFTPQRVHFGYFQQGEQPKRTINIDMVPDAKKFKILKVEDSSGVIEPSIETVEAGRHYKVNLQVKSGFDQRRINGKILVTTDFPGQETLEIPLFGGLRDATDAAREAGAVPVQSDLGSAGVTESAAPPAAREAQGASVPAQPPKPAPPAPPSNSGASAQPPQGK